MGSSHLRKRFLIGGALITVVLVGAAAFFALSTWGEVNRVTIERPGDEQAKNSADEPMREQPEDDSSNSESMSEAKGDPQTLDDELQVYLLVGSDSREDLADLSGFARVEGQRADVVMVLLRKADEAAILSLPRDLWIDDPCDGGQDRLNVMLEGCDDKLNGPSLLILTVENLIDEHIDHFAMVDLAGFQNAIDAIGGYEICVERAVRDRRANLELPAGCTMATGEQTLAWLRSRHTQELTEEGWRVIPGVSDLARNERQREFLIDMMGRLSDFTSPQALAATAQSVAPFVTVDSELTLVDAVNLAWTMRGTASGAIKELEIPVYDYVTEAGAAVLMASTPIDEVVAEFVAVETAGDDSNRFTG